MNVTQAVLSRSSTRSFQNKPISNEVIKSLLLKSSRAASGGNLQPWKIFVINDSAMNRFLEFQEKWTEPKYRLMIFIHQNLKSLIELLGLN